MKQSILDNLVCKKCGQIADNNIDKFCKHCGNPLTPHPISDQNVGIKTSQPSYDDLSFIPEIWTNKLEKIYGIGEKSVKAVDKIDIIMEPGIHGFLGPNGAGKTSTINMLIGAISITSGNAKIRGLKAGSLKARRITGFLPQDPVFYGTMSGKQYLIFMTQLNGIRRFKAKKKVQEILRYLGMEDVQDRKIEKYSGGMKQKIGIGAALVHDPKILILDEPTANLDPIGRADLIDKIKILSDKMSVFVSSHVLSEIEQMCEKVTMIHKGKIILTDTIKNIKEMHTTSNNIYILDTNSNDKMLELLKNKDYVANTWIDEEKNKINILPKNMQQLQKEIPKLIVENNILLQGFYQYEASLQDIFIDIIEKEENER